MATTRENKPMSAVEWTKRYLDAVFKKDEDTIKELECIYPYDSVTPNECREMLGYTTVYADNIPFVTCETSYNESNINELELIIGKEPVYCTPTLRDNKIINVSICDTFNDLDTRIINQEDS